MQSLEIKFAGRITVSIPASRVPAQRRSVFCNLLAEARSRGPPAARATHGVLRCSRGGEQVQGAAASAAAPGSPLDRVEQHDTRFSTSPARRRELEANPVHVFGRCGRPPRSVEPRWQGRPRRQHHRFHGFLALNLRVGHRLRSLVGRVDVVLALGWPSLCQ